jgi:murein DD-endopeptidase MepM/ murein hydrolase activator NlpD
VGTVGLYAQALNAPTSAHKHKRKRERRASKVWADHPLNGNAVKVQHPNGWSTAYLHMVDPPTLGVGQAVAKRRQIGRVGSTGSATGPHLHFMTYKPDGQTTDPATVTDLSAWTPAAPAMV